MRSDLHQETAIELGLLGIFVIFAIAETLFPRPERQRVPSGEARLFTNFGLTIFVLVAGGLFPLARMTSSIASERFGLGLTHAVHLPWAAILFASLILDSFASYWVHRLMHVTPVFWRLHRVHHSDDAVDLSTSLRNHPLELLVTVPPSMLVVLVLGAAPSVILATQTIFMTVTFWEHADLHLPEWLDRPLSAVLVTPAVHRIHHGKERQLHDRNFGNFLTLWDQLFGTLERCGISHDVGLDGQRARSDHLLEQIYSPFYRV
ncbi:MAG TPA: sterol desaturase family protein [Sphingomicrobium sp.]|nr:sterol desaturase family protein [Sphingomicrobium sp.]